MSESANNPQSYPLVSVPENQNNIDAIPTALPRHKSADSNRKTVKILKFIILGLIILSIILLIVTLVIVKQTCLNNKSDKSYSKNNKTTDKVKPKNAFWNSFRLPTNVLPYEYDLKLEIPTSHYNYSAFSYDFSGQVSINASVKENTKFIVLHCYNIEILQTLIFVKDDVWKKYSNLTDKLVKIHKDTNREYCILELDSVLKANKMLKIELSYNGKVTSENAGVIKSYYHNVKTNTTHLIIHSKLEPMGARRVMPCFDEPDKKAYYSLTILHESYMEALSNMRVTSTQKLNISSKSWIKSTFNKTILPMSTYLLAFVLLDGYKAHKSVRKGPDHQVRVYYAPQFEKYASSSLSFAIDCENFMEKYFNQTNPFPKTDHVYVPDFTSGAMENWGLVTYRDGVLIFREKDGFKRSMRSLRTIAHELAHFWFGNMVTMAWWNDTWLNEGFATYYAFVIQLRLTNLSLSDQDQMLKYTNRKIMNRDVEKDAQPVILNKEPYGSINFNGFTYSKGRFMVAWMQSLMGPQPFIKAIQKYIKTYTTKNANTQQFFAIMDEHFQTRKINFPKLYNFFMPWLTQTSLPVINANYNIKYKNLLLTQNILSVGKNYNNTVNKIWPISIYFKTRKFTNGEWLYFNKSKFSVNYQLIDKNDFIILNSKGDSYVRIMYSQFLLEKLFKGIENNFISSNDKNVILDDFLYFVNKFKITNISFVKRFVDTMKTDTYLCNWWTIYERLFVKFIDFFRNDMEFVKIRKYFMELSSKSLDKVLDFKTNQINGLEEMFQEIIILINCQLENPKAMKWINEHFNKWLQNPSTFQIPGHLTKLTLYYGLKFNDKLENWQILWDLLTNSSAQLTVSEFDLKIGLCGTSKMYLIETLLNYLYLDPNNNRHISWTAKKNELSALMSWLTSRSLTYSHIYPLIGWFSKNTEIINKMIFNTENNAHIYSFIQNIFARSIYDEKLGQPLMNFTNTNKELIQIFQSNNRWREHVGKPLIKLI